MWQRWTGRVDGEIRSGIKIFLDAKQLVEVIDDGEIPMSTQAKGKRKREAIGKGGIEGLDVGYSELKDHVEKSIFLLAEDEVINCSICSEIIGSDTKMALVCPSDGCKAASHMSCLATRFMKDEGQHDSIMPTSGRCPRCKSELQWVDLVKEMSLRTNGEKEVAQLMKKPQEWNTKAQKRSRVKVSEAQDESSRKKMTRIKKKTRRKMPCKLEPLWTMLFPMTGTLKAMMMI